MSRNLRQVAALLFDELSPFEFGIVVEIFGRPRPEFGADWYRFQACSLDGGPVRAIGNVRVDADAGLRTLERAGTIVIPGWPVETTPPDRLVRALRRAYADGARLVTICSGVFPLAATGLLDRKRVTTHWMFVDRLATRHPEIQVDPNVLYVDEGRILTSAGSAAGIDLCLHIVRRDFGAEIANQVARRLVMPPHRDGGQAQYIPDPIRRDHTGGLAPVLSWAQSALARSLKVSDLARRASMSPRTFARRFRQETGTTPYQWLMHQRLLAAQRRLETTSESIDQIAEAVGLDAAATLRRHFRRVIRTTPTAYRHRFSTLAAPGRARRKA
jgi:AraC family transcriptional regulator, transcriptional activator FtrA